MENDKDSLGKIKILYGIMFVSTGLMVFLFSFFQKMNYETILRNTIVSLMLSGTVVFMLLDVAHKGREGMLFDNFYRRNRFFLAYMVTLVLGCFFCLVPNVFWPYMSLFVILSLYSNIEIGLVSGMEFVMISVMLEENGNYGELFMYVIAGVVALALFRDIKENSAIGVPVFVSLLMQAVLLMAFNVLFQNRTFSLNLLVLPVLNLMLNLIILLIFLNMFGVYVIRKSNDVYMDINDAEFPLLVALKEKDKDEYFRAIHTAYLAERIAMGLGYNARAVKTCSYYHRIGILDGKLKWSDMEHYYIENNFPEEAVEFLHEYLEPGKGKAKSRESLAVQLSETVIASIMYLLRQNKDVKIDYDKLIDDIFDKKEKDGDLKNYAVTFYEYDQMRKILKKEKLYYDFLR